MKLPKEDNVLHCDFDTAYWCVEDIIFSNYNGTATCSFMFRAYPSREAKSMNMQPIIRPTEGPMMYGGPMGLAYIPILHQWEATFPTISLFPEGIPVSESDQKDTLYAFVKSYLSLTNYTDVLE